MMRHIVAILLMGATAHSSAMHGVLDFPRYKLVAGVTDHDELPTSGARLCLLPPGSACYTMPSESAKGTSEVEYDFGLNPVSERLALRHGGSVVFFLATFSGGGSGTLERAALLRYEPDGSITNLLPYIAVTNQSQRQMWTLPSISEYPVLVTADFIWDFASHETYFARHFYKVAAYRFNKRSDRYTQVLSYRTSKKYDGLDDANVVDVLRPERAEILRRLEKTAPES